MEKIRYCMVNDIIDNTESYKIPRFLFKGEFRILSMYAKVLYSLLWNVYEVSLSNGSVNECGEVYSDYKMEKMANVLGCSQFIMKKAIEQLKKCGLIIEGKLDISTGTTGICVKIIDESENISTANQLLLSEEWA